MFEPGNDHLELLFEFGLGQDTGGPWPARLGEALGSPAGMLRGQLAWAITHGMTDRVWLLAEHGADVTAPFEDGDTPAAVARTTGHADLVSLLVSYGAAEPSLPPLDDFIAAAVAARGRERRPRSGPGTDHAGRRPEHPGYPVRRHAAGLGPLLRAGADGAVPGAAHRRRPG
jgi:hypothetical protein